MNDMPGRPEAAASQQLSVLDQARGALIDMRGEFEKLLAGSVNPERFQRAVLAAIENNPDLLNLPAATVMAAARKAAADRLLPDGREGAIVPRYNEKTRRQEAAWQPMVRGIVKVAKLYAGVHSIDCELVYEGEPFRIEAGDDPKIVHTRVPEKVVPGREVGCYAIFRYGPAAHERERVFMSRSQIEAIRMRSPMGAKGKGPWGSDWGEMARKTVIHRGGKALALKDESGEALLRQVIEHVEEEYEFGKGGPIRDDTEPPAAGPAQAPARAPAGPRVRDVDPTTGEVQGGRQAPPPDATHAAGGAALIYVLGDGKVEEFTDTAHWRDAWIARIAAAAKKGGANALRGMLDRNDDALGAAFRIAPLAVDLIREEAEKAIQAAMSTAGPQPQGSGASAGSADPLFVPFNPDGEKPWNAWGGAMAAKLAECRSPAQVRALQSANADALNRLHKERQDSWVAWTDRVAARVAELERAAHEAQPPEPLD